MLLPGFSPLRFIFVPPAREGCSFDGQCESDFKCRRGLESSVAEALDDSLEP